MNTTLYECGCSITWDMFEHKILHFFMCDEHRKMLYSDLENFVDRLKRVISENKK